VEFIIPPYRGWSSLIDNTKKENMEVLISYVRVCVTTSAQLEAIFTEETKVVPTLLHKQNAPFAMVYWEHGVITN
jgi:hypothetical protein